MPRHDSIAHDITSPLIPVEVVAPPISHANFSIGDVVRHRLFDFRGVIFDVDPVFANSDEWYAAIPEDIRPRKDQPFYHLLAENMESSYVAYVSQQNLVPDDSDEPVDHPAISGLFSDYADGRYALRQVHRHSGESPPHITCSPAKAGVQSGSPPSRGNNLAKLWCTTLGCPSLRPFPAPSRLTTLPPSLSCPASPGGPCVRGAHVFGK